MPKEKTHIASLDSLRAFAALSVCLYHFVCKTTDYVHNECILYLFSGGKSGVQLFFVISGFVIPWSMHQADYRQKDFFRFFLKRLTRLEPPYVFSIFLALGILFLRGCILGVPNDHMQVSPKQVFLHFGYLIPFFQDYKWLNQVYWTLAIEFQYYLVIALLFVPLVKSGVVQRVFIYSVLLGLSFVGGSAFFPYWLPFFLLGILLFLYMGTFIRATEFVSVTGVILALCFLRYPVIATLYGLVPVIVVLRWPSLKIPILHNVGKYSYSVYLIHPLIGASLINILSHRFTAPLEKIAVICMGLAVTLVFSWITYRLIEKPSRKLSTAIKYRKSDSDISQRESVN